MIINVLDIEHELPAYIHYAFCTYAFQETYKIFWQNSKMILDESDSRAPRKHVKWFAYDERQNSVFCFQLEKRENFWILW